MRDAATIITSAAAPHAGARRTDVALSVVAPIASPAAYIATSSTDAPGINGRSELSASKSTQHDERGPHRGDDDERERCRQAPQVQSTRRTRG